MIGRRSAVWVRQDGAAIRGRWGNRSSLISLCTVAPLGPGLTFLSGGPSVGLLLLALKFEEGSRPHPIGASLSEPTEEFCLKLQVFGGCYWL